jgi:predicted RNA-binding Zn ribbon-like protein
MSERADHGPPADGSPPAPLRLIEELVNTRSVEFGTDEIATPGALADWLRAHGLLADDRTVTDAEHDRALRVREGLRALAALNNAEPDEQPLTDLAGLARELPLVLDVESRPPRIVPRDPGPADAALATMLGAVAHAVADGTWSRLKACREPGCRWVYYDYSRNRSRTWCSMASCGNRAKARAFRRRSG